MKLRSLSLTNVRKFAGRTATISDIGDGVTVVSEANEFGKSTFFDALHALFFLKYGAATREVKSLQPRAGGAVRRRLNFRRVCSISRNRISPRNARPCGMQTVGLSRWMTRPSVGLRS